MEDFERCLYKSATQVKLMSHKKSCWIHTRQLTRLADREYPTRMKNEKSKLHIAKFCLQKSNAYLGLSHAITENRVCSLGSQFRQRKTLAYPSHWDSHDDT